MGVGSRELPRNEKDDTMKFLARISVFGLSPEDWDAYCVASVPEGVECLGLQPDDKDHWVVTADSEEKAAELVSAGLADFPDAVMMSIVVQA